MHADHGYTHIHEHDHEHSHSHAHAHSHEETGAKDHDHSHEPEAVHSHDHGHHHDHGHGHTHSHEGTGETIPEAKALALLNYMLSHNRQHTAELLTAGKTLGSGAPAQALADAVQCYEQGNEKLQQALDLLGKGE